MRVQATGNFPEDITEIPEVPKVQGHELHGGPQMLQLRYLAVLTAIVPWRAGRAHQLWLV